MPAENPKRTWKPVTPPAQWQADPDNPHHPHIQWNDAFHQLTNGCQGMIPGDFRVAEAMRTAGCSPEQAAATIRHLHA